MFGIHWNTNIICLKVIIILFILKLFLLILKLFSKNEIILKLFSNYSQRIKSEWIKRTLACLDLYVSLHSSIAFFFLLAPIRKYIFHSSFL